MPDNALASMFGGLGEFIKLRRGFRQETAEEQRAKDDHALRQALGRQAQTRGDIDIKYLPGQYENEKLKTQFSIFGPTTELGKQYGAAHHLDPAATDSLGDAMTKAIRKRDADLSAAEGQATITGNQAKASVHAPTIAQQQVTTGQQAIDLGKINLANATDQRSAADLIQKNPNGPDGKGWHPESNNEHKRIFDLAGRSDGYTHADQTNAAVRVAGASAAAHGAQQLLTQQKLLEMQNPPGVSAQQGATMKQILLSLGGAADDINARLKTMDPRMMAAAGIRRNSPQGLEMAARFNGERTRLLQGFTTQSQQVDQMMDKLGIVDPAARFYYKNLVGNMQSGLVSADEDKAPDAAAPVANGTASTVKIVR